MDTELNILKILENISLSGWKGDQSSLRPFEQDPSDSTSETWSIRSSSPPSTMFEFEDSSSETSEILNLACDNSTRWSSSLKYEVSSETPPLVMRTQSTSISEIKGSESSSNLLLCGGVDQSLEHDCQPKSIKHSQESTLVTRNSELPLFELSSVPRTEWSKSGGLRSPGPLQCTFCGKYEKPEKRHLRCEVCEVAPYCRVKCQAWDRERHNTHDCLIRESTPWFSIKRNNNCMAELCNVRA